LGLGARPRRCAEAQPSFAREKVTTRVPSQLVYTNPSMSHHAGVADPGVGVPVPLAGVPPTTFRFFGLGAPLLAPGGFAPKPSRLSVAMGNLVLQIESDKSTSVLKF
jgi:hypothetical protein